jgi:hypothetical protein
MRSSALLPLLLLIACGGGEREDPAPNAPATGAVNAPAPQPTPQQPAPQQPADPSAMPDDLPTGLLIGYSPFGADDQGRYVRPAPARLEMLVRRGGEWRVTAITDPDSNVFHKALFLDDALVTIGGMGAYVKRWTPRGPLSPRCTPPAATPCASGPEQKAIASG